ncbi:MAG TPA: ABC transporter permease [Gemmatimonadales bacterium]
MFARLGVLPGVEQAGTIQLLPFMQNNWAFPYLAQGHSPPASGRLPSATFRAVTPGYFGTVGMRVLAGRDVEPGDRSGAPAVGPINRAMAEDLWPGEDAVGKEIQLFGSQPFTVIGVVGDIRQHALKEAPRPEMYLPMAQFPLAGMVVMLRTTGDPAALGAFATTRVLAGLLYGVGPMDPGLVVAAAAVLVTVAALAIWIPARRAGRAEPARVLSSE